MLVACTSCHHQFDVGDMAIGSKIHCHCGESVTVPSMQARDARTLHCSSCGAHVEPGAETCDYCRASVVVSEHNFGPACPECFSRMVDDASFCSTCGVKISPEVISAQPVDQECPRCDAKLVHRSVPNGSFSECLSCGGLWLPEGVFDRLVVEQDEAAVGTFLQVSIEVERKRTALERSLPAKSHPVRSLSSRLMSCIKS